MKNLFLSLLILMIGTISAHADCDNGCTTHSDDIRLSAKALTSCEPVTEVIIYNAEYGASNFSSMSLSDSENFKLDVNYGSVPCGATALQTRGYEFCTVGVEFTPVTDSGTFSTTFQTTNAAGIYTTEITGEIDPCCSGSQCDGKVTDLTLAFYGEDGSTVEVFQGKYKDYLKTFTETVDTHGKRHHRDRHGRKHCNSKKYFKEGRHHKKEAISIYSGTLNYGEEFSFSGVDKKGTLGTKIFILVNGELNAKIHTSCSKPIGPDLIVGDFTVVSGHSLNGGELASVTCMAEELPKPTECTEGNCDGKVTQLTLKNNGPTSTITVTEKHGAVIVDNAVVVTGETFEFYGSDIETGVMGTEILVTATTADGVSTTTSIHTSCSVPVGPGAEFGVFEVIDGYSRNGGELASVVCPTDDSGDTTGTTTGTFNYLASLNLVTPTESTNVYVNTENNTLVFNGYNPNSWEDRAVIQLDKVANSSTIMIFDANLTEGLFMPVMYSDDDYLMTTDVRHTKRYGFIFPNAALNELQFFTWGLDTTGTVSNMSLVDYINPDLLP